MLRRPRLVEKNIHRFQEIRRRAVRRGDFLRRQARAGSVGERRRLRAARFHRWPRLGPVDGASSSICAPDPRLCADLRPER